MITAEYQRAWIKQLYEEHSHICYQRELELPRPIICVESLGKEKLGHYDELRSTLSISAELIMSQPWQVVLEILKHEMAHQYVACYDILEPPHSAGFQRACTLLDVAPWARSASIKIPSTDSLELTDDEKKFHRRIEKLLALSASSNQHEAELALQRAHELMKDFQLQYVTEVDKDICERYINHKRKKIHLYESFLASLIHRHFSVQIVYTDLYDALKNCSYKVIELIGTRVQVLQAEHVYWFIHNNLASYWDQFRKNYQGPSHRLKGFRAKNSFYQGIINGFDEKLSSKSRKQHSSDIDHNKYELIQTQIDTAVDRYVRNRYPRLVKLSRGRCYRREDIYEHGKEKGRDLSVHPGLHKNSSNQSHSSSPKLIHGSH